MTRLVASYTATAGGIAHVSTFWGVAIFVAVVITGVLIVVRRRR